MPPKQLANLRFVERQELSCFRVLALRLQQYADRSLTTNLPCGNRRLGSDLITRQKAALGTSRATSRPVFRIAVRAGGSLVVESPVKVDAKLIDL